MITPLIISDPNLKTADKFTREDSLIVSEFFANTIQGENFSGIPSTFLRLTGCTLDCVWCFYENTSIVKKNGKSLIKNLKTGDILLTLDEKQNIVETVVQEVLSKEVDVEDLLRMTFDNINDHPVISTKEHPFYVKNRGWVKAVDLREGDVVLGPSTSQIKSYKSSINNNQKNPSSLKKRIKTQIRLRKEGKIKPYIRTEVQNKRLSDYRKINNPMKDPEISRKNAEAHFQKPSCLEKKLSDFFVLNNLPFQYVGNNKIAIGDKLSRYRFPDFIALDAPKIIEVYDTTMKYSKGYRDEEWKENTTKHYNKFGYSVEFVTQEDLKSKNIDLLREKIFNFTYNGSVVTKISYLDNKHRARLFGSKDIEKVKVFNLSCAPYNTYLLSGKYHHKWVHNCDTTEVWRYGKEYSFDHLLQLVVNNGVDVAWRKGQHLILTGGSPLKQQERLVKFIEFIEEVLGFKPYIEVENEAVRIPTTDFWTLVNRWNNSPKLSNSGMKERVRYKPDVIKYMANLPNSWFKFVISSEEDWKEIERDFLPLMSREQIVLMPEGQTRQELQAHYDIVVNIAVRENIRMCDRFHVTIWDKKTGV